MSLENVKVGDTLYAHNGIVESLEVVLRVTQTLVATKRHRFDRKTGRLKGCGYWGVMYARLATDEDVAVIRRKQMINKCSRIDFSDLTDSQLEAILKISNQKEV